MRSLKACVSDLTFDRWVGGELESEQTYELAQHLERCVRCNLRRELLQRQRDAFLERVPSWQTLARSRSARKRRLVPLAISAAALSAAAVALLALQPGASELGTRSKGGPQLGVFVQHDGRVVRAESGDRVEAGDALRLVYSSSRPTEFALLHRDARAASVFFPLAARTRALPAGKDVPLDFSLRLDAEPGDEHFFGLFCRTATDLEPLRAALASTGTLPRLDDCQVDTLTLTKQSDTR